MGGCSSLAAGFSAVQEVVRCMRGLAEIVGKLSNHVALKNVKVIAGR